MRAKTLFLIGIAICIISLSRCREILIKGDTLSINRYDAWGMSCSRELETKVGDIRDITVTNYFSGIADGGLGNFSDLCIFSVDGIVYKFPF
jgi:hypothetical protein